MEKLNLTKFKSCEVASHKLKFVSGGGNTCTGGGMERRGDCIIEYDADQIDSRGNRYLIGATIVC